MAGRPRAFETTEVKPAHGCMLTNTAVQSELINKSPRVLVQAGMNEIRAAFADQLRRGKESGEFTDEADIDAIAQMLLVLYQGFLVLIRDGSSSTDIETVVATALNPCLRAAFEVALQDDCVYKDPNIEAKGFDELAGYMEGFQEQMPGAGFVTRSFVSHHDSALINWDMVDGDGKCSQSGDQHWRLRRERQACFDDRVLWLMKSR